MKDNEKKLLTQECLNNMIKIIDREEANETKPKIYLNEIRHFLVECKKINKNPTMEEIYNKMSIDFKNNVERRLMLNNG